MLRRLQSMGHELCVLEEKRGMPQGARWHSEYFRQAGDGIATLWYDPRRGGEKLFTWVFDRMFRRGFEGRNLVHRMLVIRAALRRFDPDVVICSDGFSYAIPASLMKRAGLFSTRLVVGYIGGDILDCPQAAYGKRRTWLTDRLIKLSLTAPEVLRPVSPLLEKVLLDDGAPKEHIHVCPSHLVAPRETLLDVASRRMEISASLRSRHGISPTAPLVITLGLNQQGKGLHVLANAWPALVKAYPEARWLLCGPQTPWTVREVWPILERHRLRDTVIETGHLAGISVFEHMAAADLHINPSLGEGLNMVTVEAGAVGTPTVTSNAAGIAAWVERLGAGAVVSAGMPETLAEAVIQAFSDRSHLARWGQGARVMAEEFALERIAVDLEHLLKPRTKEQRGDRV